jgi:hypothetical protein
MISGSSVASMSGGKKMAAFDHQSADRLDQTILETNSDSFNAVCAVYGQNGVWSQGLTPQQRIFPRHAAKL